MVALLMHQTAVASTIAKCMALFLPMKNQCNGISPLPVHPNKIH
jgi:hypothetical protein